MWAMIDYSQMIKPLVVEERRQDPWYVSVLKDCDKRDLKPSWCELTELPSPNPSYSDYVFTTTSGAASSVDTSRTTTS